MDRWKFYSIQTCISLEIFLLCCLFIKRTWESHPECPYHEKVNGECDYVIYSYNLLRFIAFIIDKFTLIDPRSLYMHIEFIPFFFVLLAYLLSLIASFDAQQARSACSYIFKRVIRLIASLSIAPIIFLLIPKIFPKLSDYGLTLRYLLFNRRIDMRGFPIFVELLLIYEFILFMVLFHSLWMINTTKKFVRWSLKYLSVFTIEFFALTTMNLYIVAHVFDEQFITLAVFFHFCLFIYLLNKNPQLKSQAAKNTHRFLFGAACLNFFKSTSGWNVVRWIIRDYDNVERCINMILPWLLVLFLFSLISNFMNLKYTVNIRKDDITKKPLLDEIKTYP